MIARWLRTVSAYLFVFLTACGPGGPHKPVEGEVSGQGGVTYDQVRPIFANICAACHPARSGPNWLDYSQAQTYVKNGRLLERVVKQRTMPPPGTPQAAAITDRQRQLIGLWVKAGGPKGGEGGPPSRAGSEAGGEVPKIVQEQCQNCHGAGESASQLKVARLAGQNEDYIKTQLNRYKWRARIDPSDTMNNVALSLSDQEIAAAAKFYSSIQKNRSVGKPAELKDSEKPLFEKGRTVAKAYCTMCHMSSESGNRPIDPSIPVLVGQGRDYLTNQLIFFRSDERLSPTMHQQAKDLSNTDIEALATYFSAVQP